MRSQGIYLVSTAQRVFDGMCAIAFFRGVCSATVRLALRNSFMDAGNWFARWLGIRQNFRLCALVLGEGGEKDRKSVV